MYVSSHHAMFDMHIAYAFHVPGSRFEVPVSRYNTTVLQYQVNVLVLYQVCRTPYALQVHSTQASLRTPSACVVYAPYAY